MNTLFARNLKLAIAVSLVCVWAFATVSGVMSGVSSLLVIAAMLQWPARSFTTPMVWRWREGAVSLFGVAALVGSSWLLSKVVTEETFKSVWQNPFVVFAIWAICIVGLVRQATPRPEQGLNCSPRRTAASWLR